MSSPTRLYSSLQFVEPIGITPFGPHPSGGMVSESEEGNFYHPTRKINDLPSASSAETKPQLMLESIFLLMDHVLDRLADLVTLTNEGYRLLHQTITNYFHLVREAEEAIGQAKLYEPKFAEYVTVKKRLREVEYSLKLAEARKVVYEAQLKERDEALNLVKASLSPLSQAKDKIFAYFQALQLEFDLCLNRALQDWIEEERATAEKEFEDSVKYKEEIDKSYDDGTKNAFLDFAHRIGSILVFQPSNFQFLTFHQFQHRKHFLFQQ